MGFWDAFQRTLDMIGGHDGRDEQAAPREQPKSPIAGRSERLPMGALGADRRVEPAARRLS
jgi:hypothetical protein